MTKNKTNTDGNNVGSQRKRNPNQRSNVASQTNNTTATPTGNTQAPQQNRKNKLSANTNQSQSQSQSQASTKPSSPIAPPKTATPPPPKTEKHILIDGFNAAEIDELLKNGHDPNAMVYKPEQPATQKSAPWGQKREFAVLQHSYIQSLTAA